MMTAVFRPQNLRRNLIALAALVLASAPRVGVADNLASGSDAQPAARFATSSTTTATPFELMAHLDEESVPAAEESVPAAEDPDSPATASDAAAPEVNAGPSDDRERVPSAGAHTPASNPANTVNSPVVAPGATSNPASAAPKGPPPRTAATDTHPEDANAAAPNTAPARAGSVHTASLTTNSTPESQAVSGMPVSDTGDDAVGENANAGPPPALDVGSMQSGPDLAAASLDDEIKKADTPARMAALRVTEQARVELGAGETNDAIRDLARAVSIDPANPFEYFYLGRAYIARRNYAQALTFLQRAEIGFGARPDWLGEDVGFEGNCYEELGQNSDAALAYQRALGTAPNNLTARVGYTRMAGYLPAPPGTDAAAETASTQDALPPPNDNATAPAPEEAPAPPPPAADGLDRAPKPNSAPDYPQD